MIPEHAPRAFLLWAQAAQTGDWRSVLDRPMDVDTYAAVWMLHNCTTQRADALQEIIEVLRGRG